VIFAPGNREEGLPKDSARNCRRTGEFVVNIVGEDLAETMVQTAASRPYGSSEAEAESIAMTASSLVAPPRVTAAPASLECKVHSIQEIGENRLILGIVHRVHIKDEFFDQKTMRVLGDKLHPVGRMASPNWYCRTGNMFEMIRPA
jgi:flavin reductase (DIM6/NTAB) family NADH-FMN oxidoreductase RutF